MRFSSSALMLFFAATVAVASPLRARQDDSKENGTSPAQFHLAYFYKKIFNRADCLTACYVIVLFESLQQGRVCDAVSGYRTCLEGCPDTEKVTEELKEAKEAVLHSCGRSHSARE
jgi:hypothetical protein